MTSTCTNVAPLAPADKSSHSLRRKLVRTFSVISQRRALASLEPQLLDDIGVSRAQATREARRPFWDAPQHWRNRE